MNLDKSPICCDNHLKIGLLIIFRSHETWKKDYLLKHSKQNVFYLYLPIVRARLRFCIWKIFTQIVPNFPRMRVKNLQNLSLFLKKQLLFSKKKCISAKLSKMANLLKNGYQMILRPQNVFYTSIVIFFSKKIQKWYLNSEEIQHMMKRSVWK